MWKHLETGAAAAVTCSAVPQLTLLCVNWNTWGGHQRHSLSLKAALRFKGTCTWHFFFFNIHLNWTLLLWFSIVVWIRSHWTRCSPETTETRVPIQLWRNLFLGRIYFGYNFPLFGRGTVRIVMFSKPDKSFILFHGQKLWSFTVVAQLTVKSLKCPRHSAFILLSSELPLQQMLNSIVRRQKSAFFSPIISYKNS